MFFSLTEVSGNRKTGKIAVGKSSSDTCPPSCSMFFDCYGKFHHLGGHWKRLNEGRGNAKSFQEYLSDVRKKATGVWRHGEVGDLPGKGNKIDTEMMAALVKASKGTQPFSYTHKPMWGGNYRVKGKPGQVKKGRVSDDLASNNRLAVLAANEAGFVVNLSADSLAEADKKANLNIGPVVVVLPIDAEAGVRYTTPQGRKVVTCPATRLDLKEKEITCKTCKLCAIKGRKSLIGFPAHGTAKKRVSNRLKVLNA